VNSNSTFISIRLFSILCHSLSPLKSLLFLSATSIFSFYVIFLKTLAFPLSHRFFFFLPFFLLISFSIRYLVLLLVLTSIFHHPVIVSSDEQHDLEAELIEREWREHFHVLNPLLDVFQSCEGCHICNYTWIGCNSDGYVIGM